MVAIEASEVKVDKGKHEVRSLQDIHILKAYIQENRTDEFWNTLWVGIEVIAQAVRNSITKPHTANIERRHANAGCNSDQTIRDYYKVNLFFPFVDHVVQVDSRFSQRHQGLILQTDCRRQ